MLISLNYILFYIQMKKKIQPVSSSWCSGGPSSTSETDLSSSSSSISLTSLVPVLAVCWERPPTDDGALGAWCVPARVIDKSITLTMYYYISLENYFKLIPISILTLSELI